MKSIHIIEKTLPLAWERALIETWHNGDTFTTEYDKVGDPPSRDVTALIHVTEPFSEPRIHRGFPGGLYDLEKYRAEVLYGVHDHWIDPAAGKWEYTYHQRLFAYETGRPCQSHASGDRVKCLTCNNTNKETIDQIAKCIEMLKKCGFTHRAQAITWMPWEDLDCKDPACLQSLWFRVQNGKLNMNVRIRSNCAFKAGFMNMYAFTELQKYVAEQVGVEPGEYAHFADSFHIYGSYFNEFEGFLKIKQNRPMEDRVLSTNGVIPDTNERVRDFFVEGLDSLLHEPDMPEDKKQLVRERKAQLLQT